ncbi:MAG: tRNA (adenosine(37)-N6)-dimethylallyltransferase MiaA [Verrucomicrobiota bacterium]|nr:tRNA (adenosine(37)-N6)-dimethylallyltransferase MiaA [Verrucomicrobiota bacterium]
MKSGDAVRRRSPDFFCGVFFLVGPTAVGKSEIAAAVACATGAEIVNADAFQIYRGLDLLSAKPEAEILRRVPHHLISAVSLADTMSAARFRELAMSALAIIRARGKPALVVGGTGLYVKSLTHGLSANPPPDPAMRAALQTKELAELVRLLREKNPSLAKQVDLRNPRRVIRALEIASANNGASARWKDVEDNSRGVFLTRERGQLRERINQRVEFMFAAGVEEEVRNLGQTSETSERALGLREIRQLLAGEISRADRIAKIQQATRQYAKRQLTWFRHQTSFPALNLTDFSQREAVSAISQMASRHFAQR